MRFDAAPGEQDQVDSGSLAYLDQDGRKRRIWMFVMTMGWSRACYVELVRQAVADAALNPDVRDILGTGDGLTPPQNRP